MTSDPSMHRLPTDTDDGMVLIISGPSGVGKTTITRGVERSIPDAVFSVSVTTRQRTPADVEGVDYHFVDDAEFERMRAGGELLESAGIYGKKYGTPRRWVEEQRRRGRLVILEIDVQGAIQVRRAVPDAFGLYILPPDEATLLERLRCRKREDEAAIARRFEAAKKEIADARASGVYARFLVNREVHPTIDEAIALVSAERERRSGR
ncbi:MAG: guanylate kinase [Phycisphaerales bacterium]